MLSGNADSVGNAEARYAKLVERLGGVAAPKPKPVKPVRQTDFAAPRTDFLEQGNIPPPPPRIRIREVVSVGCELVSMWRNAPLER